MKQLFTKEELQKAYEAGSDKRTWFPLTVKCGLPRVY